MSKKILILSTWDDQGSGAALHNICKFLLEAGHEAVLVVRDKSQIDSFIIQISPPQRSIPRKVLDRLFPRFDNNLRTVPEYDFLNVDESGKLVTSERILEILPFTPDLILTGLISGFVNTATLAELSEKTGAKVYMLMPDMSPLTGGCHYAWDCAGFETDCGDCPAILDQARKDKARQNLLIKLENVRKADIRIIAGSGWTLERVRRSRLFKSQENIHNINSCIDTELFNNKHRGYAKKIFGLPENSKIIFTGSTFTHVKRKGLIYFVEALEYLWKSLDEKSRENTSILIAGKHTAENDLIEQIPFQKRLIDYIKDYRLLSLAYQASDLFVCPSIEDAGPMMISEALACGTPVAAFDMGIAVNMVIDDYNGYKAELKNSEDLARGMLKILSLSEEEYQMYSQNAVTQVEEFSSKKTLIKVINSILSE